MNNKSHFLQRHVAIVAIALFGFSDLQAQPVLQRLAKGGSLVIAHRESSIPFSYLDEQKKPIGYAIDLCLKIASAIKQSTLGKSAKKIPVEFLMVSPANRIAAIETGKADMECGSTTNNAERRLKVAFTIPHFITGARLLVRANSTITELESLQNKTLVSTKETTPLKAVEKINIEKSLGIKIVEAPDHAKAFEMVEKGAADAFVMDDVLLFGLMSNHPKTKEFKVVGKFLTTEPLAIMLPKNDPELKKLVDLEMRRLIQSGEIYPIYAKWFAQPIPPQNNALNLELSYLLKIFWKYPSDYTPF